MLSSARHGKSSVSNRNRQTTTRKDDMKDTAKRMVAERCATKIIDSIIEGELIGSRCAENDDHGVLSVWSSAAVEQIGAIIADSINSVVNADMAVWYRIYTHLRVVASQVGITHEAVRYDYDNDEIDGLTEAIIVLNKAVQCSRSLAGDARSYEEAKRWHESDNGTDSWDEHSPLLPTKKGHSE